DVVSDARQLGTSIALDADASVVLPLRPQAFRRCLFNLIENAVRYGQQVWVAVRDEGEWVEVTVEDDGPGIPPERRSDVFRPFYRIEGSRNPETGGVGLGLAIARDTVRAHGGDILLANAPQGGLRVVIRVPH
ncbi:MAG: ATP-binding protein, partial [Alphaproteobacteria bacterium]|nr:ATP-binding protein [Alphaproteobacteria bacterium]